MTPPLALVTGASTGIGYELARQCAENGFDLLIAANEPQIHRSARELEAEGGRVEAVEADLARPEGVDRLLDALGERAPDALLANAGRGLGRAFLEQDFREVVNLIDTNVTGTLYLLHRVVPGMVARGSGRVLITGSIAGFLPGAYQAAYNASKAFLDSFAFALRHEIKDTGVTVTCLMPGATETEFFERADLEDTKLGQAKKDDPKMVAEKGFKAMMKGEGDIVTGWHNKLQTAIANVTPSGAVAAAHARLAEPGTGTSTGTS